jgi:hypothetical protein
MLRVLFVPFTFTFSVPISNYDLLKLSTCYSKSEYLKLKKHCGFLLIHQEQHFESLHSKNKNEILHKKIKVNLIKKLNNSSRVTKKWKDPFFISKSS